MSEQIRVNYQALDEMARQCDKVSDHLLNTTVNLMSKIAAEMNDGALVGDLGESFSSALTGPFTASINKLGMKFEEVAGDIRGAMSDMQAADRDAGTNF